MAARSDNYYSLLSGAEKRVEEDVADLPFHPGRMASTSQFHEMSLEHQRSTVQLQRNSAAIDSGLGFYTLNRLGIPETWPTYLNYFRMAVGKQSVCN